MEQETKKSGSVDFTTELILFIGCLYGLHQNYQDFVRPRSTPDARWYESLLATVLYTIGDMGLVCLIWVDKLVYNAKFHSTITDWRWGMHPNGDMIGFGSLIFALCVGIFQFLKWSSRKSN